MYYFLPLCLVPGFEAAVHLLPVGGIMGVPESFYVRRFCPKEPDLTKTVWTEDRDPAAAQGENTRWPCGPSPPLGGHVTWITTHLMLQTNLDAPEIFTDTSALQLAPYGNYYQSLGSEDSLRRTYELLACFKKDMHKVRKEKKTWWCHDDDATMVVVMEQWLFLQVETYLTVAKCRLSPEANCTL